MNKENHNHQVTMGLLNGQNERTKMALEASLEIAKNKYWNTDEQIMTRIKGDIENRIKVNDDKINHDLTVLNNQIERENEQYEKNIRY